MKKSLLTLVKYIFLMTGLFICCQGCTEDDNNPVISEKFERGEVRESNKLGLITADKIQQNFTDSNVTLPFTLSYTVEIVSLNYYTVDRNDDEKIVSGAIFIPQGINNLPMISLQHGTQSKRDLVASVSPYNSVEGTMGLLTASLGYFTIVPDYIGFGISNEIHTYLHAESLIPCVIDLMRAGKNYCSENQITLDNRVFITGYSEGGYLSLLVQKEIEESHTSEFNLTAVAPLSGPYDLKGTVDLAFQTSNYGGDIAYLGFFFTAYNEIYGWNRLGDIFRAPYAARMSNLYDGSKTWGEILSQLPSSFGELMNPEFVSNYLNGSETDVIIAIQENTILNWSPRTQIHFFHGDEDVTVPYQNVLTAISSFESNGATNILLTTISGGNHQSSGPAASIGAIKWFESIK